MEIQILQEFASLVETCSFQETAERLHMSQSALTKHIHKLEKELDVSLFDRSTRSVQLNEYSRSLYPYAQQIIRLDEESREALKQITSQHQNVLRICFTPTAAHYGIVDVLSYFTKQHPQIELEISENTKSVELLEKKQCDFAFASENSAIDSRFRKTVFQKGRIVIIVPTDHPLSSREEVTLQEIASERIVEHVNSKGGLHLGTRQLMDLFEKNGITPKIASTASFTSTVIKFVEHGTGIAALPVNRIPQDAFGISVINLVPEVCSYIYLLYPANKQLTGAERTFRDFIQENAEE